MSIRVHQLAKELELTSKGLMEKLASLGVKVKSHASSLDDETAEIVRHEIKEPKKKAAKPTEAKEKKEKPAAKHATKPKEIKAAEVKTGVKEAPKKEVAVEPLSALEIELPVTVKELAEKINKKPNDIIAHLMKKGVFASLNQNLPEDIAIAMARESGYEIKKPPSMEDELLKEHRDAEHPVGKAGLELRAPIVTFMGHVDHGKTSLLDYIRKAKVAAKEKGGITQHIGAYEITIPGKGQVTFLDTPGHAAFTAMRARGANATDIVVLVVAADDGVMPQTIEAIDHARAANVTIVVAINKCDLPNINIEKVRRELSQHGLMSEEWGGKTITVPVSAKTGEGVDKLLEMLLLEAELLELKANPKLRARGVVVEAKLSPGQGPVSTVLIKNGTLRVGDVILSGLHYGRVKAMITDRGKRIDEAPPSTPVEILGLSGVPEAGNEFFVVKDEKKARMLSTLKQEEKRLGRLRGMRRMSLEDLHKHIKEGIVKELKIILKADVQGSVEALKGALDELSVKEKEVKINVTHMGAGNINESDVMLALVSNAVLIGFHVKAEPKAEEIAKKEMVEIKLYDIIYEAVADVKAALEGLLEPITKEIFQGRAQVRQVFQVTKVGTVAGCYIVKGTVPRTGIAKLIRNKEAIYTGKIKSLKHLKDDIKEAREGFECGISLEGTNNVKPGDLIESYRIEKITRRLNG